MQKLLSLIAGVALLGFAGIANAEDTQPLDQPIELTAAQMDTVTAGRIGGGTRATRVIRMGSAFTLIFNGSYWTVVYN